MQEVRGDDVWTKWSVGLLEYHCHDVVANVTSPLKLLLIGVREGEEGGNMEHDLPLVEHLVHVLPSSLEKNMLIVFLKSSHNLT